MHSILSAKKLFIAISALLCFGMGNTSAAAVRQTEQYEPKLIEETGIIYATDQGILFDADSGAVYNLKGNDLLEYAGERAIITGSLTTGDNGEYILNIDSIEIEEQPDAAGEQPAPEDIETEETTTPDPGYEGEGVDVENPPAEEPQQN